MTPAINIEIGGKRIIDQQIKEFHDICRDKNVGTSSISVFRNRGLSSDRLVRDNNTVDSRDVDKKQS